MKAAQIKEYGDADAVEVVDIEQPTAKAGHVVVQVSAASLNPFDTMVRSGYLKDNVPLKLPVTLGGDIAGTVVEVGTGVNTVKVGDKVFGQANVVAGNSGAFAEYAATSAEQVAKAPSNISTQEAASLALVGVSAWQALTQYIGLTSGQKLFINGGSGAIGRVAIQIAKHLGAHVATTATGAGIAVARAAGADDVIDYKTDDFTKVIHDFDAVFDTVGGEALQTIVGVVSQGGTVVSMVGQPDEALAKEQDVTAISQMTKVTSEALDALRELVESGVVTPAVGAVFTLDQIQEAFKARESGTVAGKVVLAIQ